MLKTMPTAFLAAASSLSIGFTAPATAQQSGPQMTAEQAAAAFGAREKVLDASLSPAGDQIAMILPGPGTSTVVSVVDLKTNQSEAIGIANGEPLSLSSCGWVSNVRLLCRYYGISAMEGATLPYSRLVAMDNKGNNIVPLGARERSQDYAQQSDGYVVDWLDGSTDKVLMARNYVPAKTAANRVGSIYDGLGVDLIDTSTARADHLEMADPIARVYLSDGRGNVRIKGVDESMKLNWQTRGSTTFSYRLAGSKDWKPFSVYSGVTDEGMYPVAIDPTANAAYSLMKTNGRDALYKVALDGSLTRELVFAHPQVDVSGIIRIGRQGRVIGASYATERRQVVYFDPSYKKLGEGLTRALPKLPLIRFTDSSADETKHLIHASSDVDPGKYFLYDSKARSLEMLFAARPELEGVRLGVVKPVSFRAGDGTMIPGYLTLPAGSDGKKLPAIVMPHGGPASRDEWGFDWLAQFFVNRGFAVLQPNFRGSSGYGEEWFKDNGFKSWKTAIGDVADAGKWLVSEGIADPAKLAIVGWSYGGYAALQSNVLDPDLFKAVIAIAPVTDLNMLRGEQRGFTNMRVAQDYIGDGPHLKEGSPAKHASAFKAPVLMFHGDKDINVSVNEARKMDSELRGAGKSSELIVFKKLDHQLNDSAVRAQMLGRSEAFLRKALKM